MRKAMEARDEVVHTTSGNSSTIQIRYSLNMTLRLSGLIRLKHYLEHFILVCLYLIEFPHLLITASLQHNHELQ